VRLNTVREAEYGWIAALHDRQIGKAMSLMHRQPERDWRVESLACEVGMSRSGFSARFSALVGEPVHQYLTGLRMQLAHRARRLPFRARVQPRLQARGGRAARRGA
jgi:transcriptional regulator GlxA family with amidase domain